MGFLSGIFSKKTSRVIYREDEVIQSSDDGLTGVARYVNAQKDKMSIANHSEKLSGVDTYLKARKETAIELTNAEKDEINARISATIEQRAVEENLMSDENKELSGVAKYLESQEKAYSDAQKEAPVVTGVAKYIKDIVDNKPVATGVSKYLLNRVETKVSSVDRYVINKALADKSKPEVVILPPSGVTKYLESRPTLLTSRVAKYIARQAVLANKSAVA